MLFLTLLYRFFNFPVRKKPSQHQPGPSASGHPGHPAPGIVTLIKNGIPNSHFGNKTLIRILPKIWNTDRVPDPGCLLFPANLKYYRIISTESAKSGCLVFYQRAEIPEIQRNYQFFFTDFWSLFLFNQYVAKFLRQSNLSDNTIMRQCDVLTL